MKFDPEKYLRRVYYAMTPRTRRMVRRVVFLPVDTWDWLAGARAKGVPARGRIFTGSGNFVAQGRSQLRYLMELAGLKEDHSVLDVGSGIGRTAIALTGYLRKDAVYEGFDVVKSGVDWCQGNITRNYPNFKFKHVDLENDLYNRIGRGADSFEFPYPSSFFDVVFLFSVFTHMDKNEIGNYLSEINRVLKQGGRCLCTFFIYDERSEETVAKELGSFSFPIAGDGVRFMDRTVKSANVAIEEHTLRAMVSDSGLRWLRTCPGYWKDSSVKDMGYDFQDMVVLLKPELDQ